MGSEDIIAQGGLGKYQQVQHWITEMVVALDALGVGFGGFSVSPRDDEVMMVLRGTRGEEAVVAFIFADGLDGLLRKGLSRARSGKLRWKKDQYKSTSA